MNDREKLADLIADFHGSCGADEMADYLIANGVVVQKEAEWKLVEYAFDDYAKCTHCNEEYCLSAGWSFADWQKYMHHCPNCGAKIKEVK